MRARSPDACGGGARLCSAITGRLLAFPTVLAIEMSQPEQMTDGA
jgi:hypothetical protein